MPNPSIEEMTMTNPMKRWLEYVLGDLDRVPIFIEEARVIEIQKVPGVHVQFFPLDGPHMDTPLVRPLLWNWKHWHLDELRRRKLREKSALERVATNKASEQVAVITRAFQAKYRLPDELARYGAEKIVINQDLSMMRQLKIPVEDLTDAEFAAAKGYLEMLKQREIGKRKTKTI
jgi:hypothetical protein